MSLQEFKYQPDSDDLNNSIQESGNSGFSLFPLLHTVIVEGLNGSLEGLCTDLSTAPPNLQSLTLQERQDFAYTSTADSRIVEIATRASQLSSLQDLHFVIPRRLVGRAAEDRREEISAAAKIMIANDKRVQLWEQRSISSVIPPYLFGEQFPEKKLIYDSNDKIWRKVSVPPGFHDHLPAVMSDDEPLSDSDGDMSDQYTLDPYSIMNNIPLGLDDALNDYGLEGWTDEEDYGDDDDGIGV